MSRPQPSESASDSPAVAGSTLATSHHRRSSPRGPSRRHPSSRCHSHLRAARHQTPTRLATRQPHGGTPRDFARVLSAVGQAIAQRLGQWECHSWDTPLFVGCSPFSVNFSASLATRSSRRSIAASRRLRASRSRTVAAAGSDSSAASFVRSVTFWSPLKFKTQQRSHATFRALADRGSYRWKCARRKIVFDSSIQRASSPFPLTMIGAFLSSFWSTTKTSRNSVRTSEQ